jgi:hypothetical protein
MLNMHTAQAIAPTKRTVAPALLLLVGMLVLALGAGYGYYQQTRTEHVLVVLRPLVHGQQITSADVGTIEVPLHRPQQLAGMTNPALVVGKYAAGDARANDLVQPTLLLDTKPEQPVYPSGEELKKDMVVLPFATGTIGPLTHDDVVNVGFNDPTGDPTRCANVGGTGGAKTPSVDADGKTQAYACRLITGVNVLYVDDAKGIAYLELPPDTAHVVWALQAANLGTWGERYGAGSQPLAAMDRLDIGQADPNMVTIPMEIPGTPPTDATAPAAQGSAK